MKLAKQLQVFLLYARSDKHNVQGLYRRLVKDGVAVWLDEKTILPGQDWAYEIRGAIWKSDLIVVCLSTQFNQQGGYRHEEVKIALEKANSLPEGGNFLIPARLEICDLPASLRRWQCVNLFEAGGYKRLVHAFESWARST